MKERSVQTVVQLLLKKFQASDTTAGLLIGSIPAAIGVLLVPIISYRSDRHRGPWGRRIPYLMLTTPIAAGAMVGLAFSPALGRAAHEAMGARSLGLYPTILVFFGLFWTIFEFGTLAANSVFGGLINDVVPLPLLGRFYGLFRALSLIAGMIFNFWLLGLAEVHYVVMFLSIGLLYGGGFTLMCLKVREGDYPPPPPAPVAAASGTGSFFAAARLYLRECFTSAYYLWVFLFLNISLMAFMPVNLFSVFFAKSLNMDMNLYGKYLALTYGISLLLSYSLGSLADRFHPLRVGLVTLALYAAATLWGGLVIRGTVTFAVAFVAHGVLSGTFFTTTASLMQRLFPRGKFAQFASASTAIGGVGTVLLGPAMGQVLDRSHHVYRYTYLASCGLTVLALISGAVVYAKFVALGGPDAYVAPDCDDRS
jgi:MFS family permease